MIETIRKLWKHADWADRKILAAIREDEEPSSDIIQEFAHVIGSEEVWLARLERRRPRVPVWPSVSRFELADLIRQTHDGYARYLAELTEADLSTSIAYTNSAGKDFKTPVGDILLHVALHAQYHRGKVNLLLRQSGREPAPADYIAFVRGVPAATRAAEGAAGRSGS